MSEHSTAIDKLYRMAKKFKHLVPSGISQVGEKWDPKKNARSRKNEIKGNSLAGVGL